MQRRVLVIRYRRLTLRSATGTAQRAFPTIKGRPLLREF
jgi:hypothetical protein